MDPRCPPAQPPTAAEWAAALGARRVAWIAGEDARRPRGYDPGLLATAGGGVRRWGAAQLRRFPRARAAELRALLVARVGAGVLWVEGEQALTQSDAAWLAVAGARAREEELLAARRGLAQRDALRERGSAALAVAHDLRHELSLASLLVRRAREDAAVGQDPGIEHVLARARSLCDDALRGRESAVREFAVEGLLTDVARHAEAIGARAGVAWRVECARDARLRAEREPLERALRNLALNAAAASPDGAVVVLAGAVADGVCTLVVEDRGRGMSAAEAHELFASGRSASGGSGCGTLSLLSCVERLDGALTIESRPGGGTCARLELPSRATLAGKELFIGDERLARGFLAQRERAGAQVVVCRAAGAALALLREALPTAAWVERGWLDAELPLLGERLLALGGPPLRSLPSLSASRSLPLPVP